MTVCSVCGKETQRFYSCVADVLGTQRCRTCQYEHLQSIEHTQHTRPLVITGGRYQGSESLTEGVRRIRAEDY